MKKTELWDTISNLLKAHNASEELTNELAGLIKPKVGGAKGPTHEPVRDENGTIIEVYCQWHKCYEPVEAFSTSKSATGYHHECKEAVREWQKYARAIKAKEAEIATILDRVLDGEIDQNQAKVMSDNLKADIKNLTELRLNKVNFGDTIAEPEPAEEPVKETKKRGKK